MAIRRLNWKYNEIDYMLKYLILMRVGHWIKNALVLLPAFFLGSLFEYETLKLAAVAFISYSLVSSGVYVLNDIRDLSRDRLHPIKCKRPLASGAVRIPSALFLFCTLIVFGFSLSFFSRMPICSFVTLLVYFAVNLAYSIGLKNVPLVDIFVLASGFVFRIFYGGFHCGVPISSWLFLCVFSGAMYFACGKRLNEIRRVDLASETRPVLKSYGVNFLSAHYYLFCALSILFYCLWTISRTNQHSVGKLGLTIPLLVFIVVRYNYLMERDDCDGDPVPVLLHDGWLMISLSFFALLNFVILYFGDYLPRLNY